MPRHTSVLRSIEDLDEPLTRSEACRTLANARVVWADYHLIARDFADIDFAASLPRDVTLPHGANALPTSDRPDIDAWLLLHAAIMSEAQLQHTHINEPIPVFGPTRIGYRPPRYGRALVVQMTDTWSSLAHSDADRRPQGLLDVKGCGVAPGRVPMLELHRSGLLPLPVAFSELVTQLIVERIFECLGVDVRGVGVYAILDLGFRIKSQHGSLIPAGAIIRRAHQRPVGNIELPNYGNEQHRIKLAIEFMLRRFGVTSCSPDMQFLIWREGENLRSLFRGASDRIPPAALARFLMTLSLQLPVKFDMVNVQLVRGATLAPFSAVLVDFGQYDFNDRQFTDPLGCYVAGWPLNWGGFMDRNSRYYVQPDDQIAVDGMLGRLVATPRWVLDWTGANGPAETNGLFLFGAELARDVKRGTLTRSAFERRISSFVRSATSKLDRRQSNIARRERDRHAVSRSTTLDAAVPGGVSDALDHVEGYLAQNTLRRLYRGARRPDGAHQAAGFGA
jgi:hypothetical protein